MSTKHEFDDKRVKIGVLCVGEQDGYSHIRHVRTANYIFSKVWTKRRNISQFIPLDFRMTRLSALMICSVLMSSMIKRLVQKHTNVFQNVENFERLENADHETFRSRATSCLVWIRRASKSMSLSHLCTRWTITTIAIVIYLFCSFSEFVTLNTLMVKILLDWWTR